MSSTIIIVIIIIIVVIIIIIIVIINECSGKHKHESTRFLYLPSEEGGK